jgi:hypothetical protein
MNWRLLGPISLSVETRDSVVLFPTAEEAERRAKEAERQAKEAALASVVELEALLKR